MRPYRILFFVMLIASAVTTSSAQVLDLSDMFPADVVDINNVWKYYSFRQPTSPTTYGLSRKGQFRIETSTQFHLSNMPDTIFMLDNDDERFETEHFFKNKFMVDGSSSRINISYTPWEHITLGAAFAYTLMIEHVGHVVAQLSDVDNILGEFDANNLFRHQVYSSNFMSGELSGSYHSVITNFLAYEARTAISVGKGVQSYKESYGYKMENAGYKYKADELRYGIFNHNFVGGLSVFTPRRTLQASFLLDVGYTTYFNKRLVEPFLSQQLFSQVIDPFNRNPWDLYYAPWFILSINTPAVFSIRFHYGFEVSKQHRRYASAPLRTTAGLTLSWRLTNTRMVPKKNVE